MSGNGTFEFRSRLKNTNLSEPEQVPAIVDAILQSAEAALASDVHLVPTPDRMEMSWRIDGVLQRIDTFPKAISPNLVGRLKVLAELLTYRTEVPQEGRIRQTSGQAEMRVSTFPTLYGEKVVVRLFVGTGRYRELDDLGLPDDVGEGVRSALHERGGLLLMTGPAGSGKTTTAYACLRRLAGIGALESAANSSEAVRQTGPRRSLVSLEDPIEAVIEGVAQSQVQLSAGFTYDLGLRSLLRQDPDVMLVGEIRDQLTAQLVFRAALSGHLVLSTFHAGSAVGALQRLHDMGIESYQLKSGLLAVLSQRLIRQLCQCAIASTNPDDRLGLPVEKVWLPQGCPECRATGYRGRVMLAELLHQSQIEIDRITMSGARMEATGESLPKRGLAAVASGKTSPAEFRRIFGLRQT